MLPRNDRLTLTLAMTVIFFIFLSPSILFAEDSAKESVEKRQKNQILAFFLKDPSTAQFPSASSAISLYNQAVRYFENSEYELARKTVKDSLAQDDTNPLAYELLGDIDNFEQQLDEAKMNYQIAYNLNSSKRVREKLDKLSKEKQIDTKLKTYKEEHFIIKYHDQEQSMEGFELRDLLRQTYRQISQDFAYYFKHQVVVLLYDEEDFKQVTNAPHWAVGIYDGKVRMPINRRGFSDLDLKATTTHEVTHAFVTFMSNMKAPAWINEGLAMYEENKVKNVDMRAFQDAVKSRRLFSLVHLMSHQGPMTLQDATQITLFYRQSFHLVSYLVDRYKMFRVKEILAEYGKGKNSDQVIRSVLKISIDRLQKEWLEKVGA